MTDSDYFWDSVQDVCFRKGGIGDWNLVFLSRFARVHCPKFSEKKCNCLKLRNLEKNVAIFFGPR